MRVVVVIPCSCVHHDECFQYNVTTLNNRTLNMKCQHFPETVAIEKAYDHIEMSIPCYENGSVQEAIDEFEDRSCKGGLNCRQCEDLSLVLVSLWTMWSTISSSSAIAC